MSNHLPLLVQIRKSITNLERGEVQRTDRVFLYHVLENLEQIVENPDNHCNPMDAADSLMELIGSTEELILDGLDD